MADAFRKDFHTSAKEKITPDATKSTSSKLKESITDTADRVARGVQPDSTKGDAQAMHDKSQRASDRTVHGGTAESV
ncbi:MAG: hypothetical protein OHK93_000347 [Ramalina farinacea]|uniref:Uncharacterized protein n=1 Tax=Ramalina farinacea TaxID=258253 RepID=A0AA43QJ12_9LECA|nr:hypothetical protein [Ramalina farinacea]